MLRRRAERAFSLDLPKLILLSVSQVLVVAAVVSLVSLNLALYLGYDPIYRALLALWAITLLLTSYVLYRQVKGEIDILDYLGSLVFYHRLRRRHKELDMINTVLFLGLVLITLTPFIYTFVVSKGYSVAYPTIALALGGLMVALAVSSYVLLEEMAKP